MNVQKHSNGSSRTLWQPNLTAASQGRISILLRPMVCTIRTATCGSLGPRVTWYTDPTSLDMIVHVDEKGLTSEA